MPGAGAVSAVRGAVQLQDTCEYREDSLQPRILSTESEWLPVAYALTELERELSSAALKVHCC
jgi:hypothetical protein